MTEMRTWNFDNGVIVGESFHDADLHCFEVFSGDRYLGTIYPNTIEDMNQCIKALDNGEDPISGGWEDGCGNVCSMNGWGDGVIYVEGETERNYNSFDDFCNNYWDCVECPYAYIVPDGSCEKHFNEIMRDELTEKLIGLKKSPQDFVIIPRETFGVAAPKFFARRKKLQML